MSRAHIHFGDFDADAIVRDVERKSQERATARERADTPLITGNPDECYKDIEWENTRKTARRYDQSLVALRERGYERHQSPKEAFSLIIAYLEGKLTTSEWALYESVRGSYSEWLNVILRSYEIDGRKMLHVHENLELAWVEREAAYFPSGLDGELIGAYDITALPFDEIVTLNQLPPALVKSLYGRHLEALPSFLREDVNKFYIPAPGTYEPTMLIDYRVGTGQLAASRGVRKKMVLP